MQIWINSLTFVWLFAGMSTAAVAHDADEYLRASQEFEHLVSQATPDTGMPRITNKKVLELLSTLSDSKRFLDSATYQIKDMSLLAAVCTKANAFLTMYLLFDISNGVDPRADQKQVTLQVQTTMEQNFSTFQDELERLQPFSLRCGAKQIALVHEFVLSLKPEEFTDVRRGGLRKFRDGMFGMYHGVLQNINISTARKSYRTKLVQSMAETAKQYSSILQTTVRRQLFSLVKSIQASAPREFQSCLEAIANAMSDTRCDGACRF